MKLLSFETAPGDRHIGALLDGDRVVDFTASSADPTFGSMLALIDAGPAGWDEARAMCRAPRDTLALESVRLLAPLPEPRQMRDFLCFEKHFRQARANRHLFGAVNSERDPAKVEIPSIWYEEPIYYKCNRFSVIGTGEDIVCPRYCSMLDYELEFGIVLGRGGKDIDAARAREHVFGYTIFNDVSARDQQIREMAGGLGPSKGKDFDTGNVMGPWLVTADEIPDPYDLTMTARVNGEEWSRGNSGEMRHRFERVLEHVSMDETLMAGEFFGSGTVGGGCGLELGRFLADGDVVELEIEGLGRLRNRVVVRQR